MSDDGPSDLKIFLFVTIGIIGATTPGALLTAAIDHLIPLDRGQLWTFSIVLSVAVLVTLGTVLFRTDHAEALVLWYPGIVIAILLGAAILSFGFGVRGVGTFVERFFHIPMSLEDWLDNVSSMIVTSIMTLACGVVVVVAGATSVTLNKLHIWELGMAVYVAAGYAIGWWGRHRRWSTFMPTTTEFPTPAFDATVAGIFVFGLSNIAAMVVGCVGYFGFKVDVLRVIFEQMAAEWPTFLNS